MDASSLALDPLRFYTVVTAIGFGVMGLVIAALRVAVAWKPYRTWLFMLPVVFAALWLGKLGWAALVTVISIYAFKEFAKATGLYREIPFVLAVYAAILAMNLFAFLPHYGFFMVAPLWAVAALTLIPILLNRIAGMLQAFALSVVGVVYFAWFLAHLTYLAQAPSGLGFVIYVVLATQFNDALAFLFGKKIGRHHWTVISPNKTVEGSLFALATSIALAFLNWSIAFPQLPWWGVLAAGVIVGIGGQIGDLTMANVKRNVGIKDFGTLLPGHGGMLDRVNSLMLVAPVFFHFMGYFFGAFPG
ncbi:MAG TPA: phosphatidate cytidylyltransferase [Candidatus Limnocylindria bacterium]|jgi:phosphatidate cytidylyltransferase|nr:phosphatidate cytidylyltransferase [Candidatus Limnocylindria bacterium]